MAGATELPEQPALRQRVRVYGREVMESSSEYKLLQQTRDEATTTRRIALGSLLVALCSVVAVYMLQNATSTGSSITLRESFPGNMEEIQPGWAWTTVPAIVRSDKSLKSKQLGIVQGDTRVMVKEVKGIRARISEPMAGWISCISGDVQVVTKHEDEQLQQIKKRIMAHQKSQRDLLAALENVKKKGQLHPKLLGEIKEVLKNESKEFDKFTESDKAPWRPWGNKNKAACSMQFSCGAQQFFRCTTAAAAATVPWPTARWVAHETRAICVAPSQC